MGEQIKKALIIMSNPVSSGDNREIIINQLCASFCEGLSYCNIEIDYIDLYKDNFNPVHIPNSRDTQAIEYQIRIRKSDIICIFHPVWWGLMPAILKGFCDKVFQSGFAFNYKKSKLLPLLEDKQAIIVTTSRNPKWKDKLTYNNMLEIFWKRSILQPSGIKSKYFEFNNLRKVDDEEIQKWKQSLRDYGESLGNKKKFIELI
jgi:NAD(P)H dehydrogenase (quinone)